MNEEDSNKAPGFIEWDFIKSALFFPNVTQIAKLLLMFVSFFMIYREELGEFL